MKISSVLAVTMISIMMMTSLLAGGTALAALRTVTDDDPNKASSAVSGPKLRNAAATVKDVPMGSVKISADITPGSYVDESGSAVTVPDTTVSLLRNGQKVKQDTVENGHVDFKTAVSYEKKDEFELKTSMKVNNNTYQGQRALFSVRSAQMKKNNVDVTKLSSASAMVRWGGVDGAAAYRIYMGKKRVKELGSGAREFMVKNKKAGSSAYRVLPVRKAEGKKYEGKSVRARPKVNVMVTSNTGSPDTYSSGAKFVLKKITLNGNKYKIKGWGVNYSAITKLKEFKMIKVSILCDGKKAVEGTLKNVKCSLEPKKKKALTFTVKGKKNVDIRSGWVDYSFICDCDPGELTL